MPCCVAPVGASVGSTLGDAVGDVGVAVGAGTTAIVGAAVGYPVGHAVGGSVGKFVGMSVGDTDGESVGGTDGDRVGMKVGDGVGATLVVLPAGHQCPAAQGPAHSAPVCPGASPYLPYAAGALAPALGRGGLEGRVLVAMRTAPRRTALARWCH